VSTTAVDDLVMADTIAAHLVPVPEIRLEVSVASGSPIGITELEVVYDGTKPPIGLFDALVAAGWSQPVAAPPPRSAIDWATPDPAAGTRYTIAPYRAVSRVALPPDRNGTGLVDAGLVDAAMVTAASHGASVPVLVPTTPEASLADAIVSAVIATPRVEGAVAMFGPSVVVLERTPTVITTTNTYRGRTCESQAPAIRISVCVPAAELDDVTTILQQVAASAPEVHASRG
jgi:hypothetical protein